MRMRWITMLMVSLGLVATACGGDDDSSCVAADGSAPVCTCGDAGAPPDAPGLPDGSPARDAVSLGDASQADLFDRLTTLLSAPDALQMPPVGVQYGANQLTVSVTQVPVTDGLAAAVEGETPGLLAFFSVPGSSLLGLIDRPDLHLAVRSGWREQAVIDAVVPVVAEAGTRAEVAAILAGLEASHVHLQAYDVGAEIVAREIVYILPLGGTVALRIELTYVQA